MVIGIVQGFTEFLPISSSAHLVLVPWWLGWSEATTLTFAVAVHLGTLVAVLIYFRQDWIRILEGGLEWLRSRSLADPYSRLFILLLIATVPAALAGVLLADPLEQIFSSPQGIALLMLVTAALLAFSERYSKRHSAGRQIGDMTAKEAFVTGVAQMFALLPGISRSGSTIAAGLFQGISRAEAARFSFLMSAPVIAGAAFVTILDLLKSRALDDQAGIMLIGALSAGITGYLTIALLLNFLRRRTLHIFAAYCVAASVITLLAAALGR